MATRPKAVIESRNGEKFSPITITKNVLTDDGQNLHDILSDRKEDMMTPTIENSSSMFKVGQGDNVDYSENVVDGAYESCVFKGRSLVNLSNLHKSFNDVTLNDYYVDTSLCETSKLKLGTPYTLVFYTTVHGGDHDIYGNFELGVSDVLHSTNTHPDTTTSYSGTLVKNGWSKKCVTFTDFRGYKYLSLRPIRCNAPESGKSIRFSIKGFILLEGDWSNKDLPFNDYFEGICDCKSPILSNAGKNLYPVTYLTDNAYVDKIRLKANTRYTLKNSVAFSPQNRFKFRVYDLKQNPLNDSQLVEIHKDLYYNSASVAFCNNGNKDYIECSFTPKIDCYISITSFNSGVDSNRDYHIQLEEGSTVTTYEPYKSNILSANGDKIELTEEMFEQGTVLWTNPTVGTHLDELKSNVSNRIRLKGVLNAKPNTVYRVVSNDPSDNYWYLPLPLDSNMCKTNYAGNKWIKNGCVTTTSDTAYLTFVIKKEGEADIAVSEFSKLSFELSEVDKTIVLRSLPNGVYDTLNVETGEYVQNVIDIVLDGTENWILNNWGTDDNFCSFEISSLDNTKIQNVYKKNSYIDFYCDTFKVLTNCKWNYMSEKHIRQWSNGDKTTISVIIPKTELKTYNVAGFIEYLTENNIRINIRANNPIVSTVDIQGFPHAYTNGHVLLSSGSIEQSLTPKVEYSVVTNRNGQIRSNQKMVERHQKQLDRLQAMILTNLVNTQYEQTLTNLKYDLKNVREEVK